MKKLLTIILFLSVISCYGQARIGYTLEEIKREFPDKEVVYYEMTDGNYATIEFYTCIFTYHLNEHNRCYSCNLRPNNTKILHEYIEMFNSKYEIVGLNSWITLDRPKVKIVLCHDENWSYYYFNFKDNK
jgi:hypothetical protein